MNPYRWIEQRFVHHGFEIPPELKTIIDRNELHQRPFRFFDEAGGLEDAEHVRKQFPARDVIPFARRGDYDGIICVVLSDPVYPRGSVIVLHWDGWPGTEVDEDHPSLSAWARSAENEIEECEKARIGLLYWIPRRLVEEGLEVPAQLEAIIERHDYTQRPYSFMDEEGSRLNAAKVKQRSDRRDVIPIAREDREGMVSIVLEDPVYKRGSVIVIHQNRPPGSDVADEYPSLAAWAEAAEDKIEQRAKLSKPQP